MAQSESAGARLGY